MRCFVWVRYELGFSVLSAALAECVRHAGAGCQLRRHGAALGNVSRERAAATPASQSGPRAPSPGGIIGRGVDLHQQPRRLVWDELPDTNSTAQTTSPAIPSITISRPPAPVIGTHPPGLARVHSSRRRFCPCHPLPPSRRQPPDGRRSASGTATGLPASPASPRRLCHHYRSARPRLRPPFVVAAGCRVRLLTELHGGVQHVRLLVRRAPSGCGDESVRRSPRDVVWQDLLDELRHALRVRT